LKTNFLSLLFIVSGSLSISAFSQDPNYAPKEFYLVDSLDLNLVSETDKQFMDSCLTDYHAAPNDTSRINAVIGIVDNIWNNDVWPVYNRYVLHQVVNLLPYKSEEAEILSLKRTLAATINNEGFYYRNLGNVPLALRYYHESLKILEELQDTISMTYLYSNLGAIYQHQETFDKALEYHQKALDMKEIIGDSAGIAVPLMNIGVVYQRLDSMKLAGEYFRKALDAAIRSKDVRATARGYYNVGFLLMEQDSFEKSRDYFQQSLDGYESYRDKEGISMTSSGIGRLGYETGNFSEARKYAGYGLEFARQLGNPDLIRSNANVLYLVANSSGDWKTALEMRNLEFQMRDSLANSKNIKMSADAEAKYQYEKQQAIRDIEHQAEIEKEQSIAAKEKEQQTIVLIAVSAGLLVVVVFSVFLNNRIRVTRKQKKIIEEQKHEVEEQKKEVEEKNKEILDSIRYAKRIQDAILPSMDAMGQALKNGFVLYKPKDVVAGDFYWMEKVGSRVYFAAADCTGHGVPGAMVSVVCSNALSKALLEENAVSTGDLLDKTRDIVIHKLAKSGEEMKDGMDISLCMVDFEKMELQWSGANNPLWIVRPSAGSGLDELIEYKADKQPVGVHTAMKPFTSHHVTLLPGDKIYLMTDGFQDQFGGAHGKKFKAAQLKELILRAQHESMDQQKEKLDQAFENWRKGFEQIDDVCIIGVSV
jgi:serine phosphatase RsbU (regulator of sigma subunit)/Tfp pilus assembly protein PilF